MALLRTKNLQLPDPADTPAAAAEVVRVTVPAATRASDGHWEQKTTAIVELDYRVPEDLRAVYDRQDTALGYDWDTRAEVVRFGMREKGEKGTGVVLPLEGVMIPDDFTLPSSLTAAACFDRDGRYLPGGNPAGVAYRVHPRDLPLRWHRHQLVLSRAQSAAYTAGRYDTAAARKKAREQAVVDAARAGDFKPDFRERQVAAWTLGLVERGEKP